MLKIKDLHIGFRANRGKETKTLFKTEELEINKGDFIAVIGPNGSGKTTFFNTMLGFSNLLKGEILFQEKNIETLTKDEKVKTFSFVPSKFLGVNNLNVYDLIAMGRSPYTNLLNQLSEHDKEVVDKIINQLNLNEIAYKNTLYLSDGERQIAMIGKALAQETEVIILDEPTAFLDYNNRRKVLNILKEIAKKQQKMIFMSSHDLELCFDFCNRILAINKEEQTLEDFHNPFSRGKIIEKIF